MQSRIQDCQEIAQKISAKLPPVSDLEQKRLDILKLDSINERTNLEKETRLALMKFKYDNYIEQLHKKFENE